MKKLIYAIGAIVASMGVMALQMPAQNNFTPGNKLRVVEGLIAEYYVDTVNEEKICEDAIKRMLEELDPHSSYMNAEETREMNEPLQGNFSGIGITFNMLKDTLYVIETVGGGPSERVGILAGDRIIRVNDTIIAGVKMKNSDIMKRLRGPKGTKVDVKILRRSAGASDTIDFRITRAEIPIYSIDAAYMVDNTTGYVRLNRFGAESFNEFYKAVHELKKSGMQNLIFDLTDNGGGYINAATDILNEILERGQISVYTEGRKTPRYDYYAKPYDKKPLLDGNRIVVMVNQNSASASEITSGAIQDWDRGVLVGRRTFGKGLVQRPFPFPDGSMVKLSIAHYFTPSGRNIQRPYTEGEGDKYYRDIVDRLNSGELIHADSIKYIDSLKVTTLKKGRTIYGGGGITPDVFVPLDTTKFSNYYRDMSAKGVINQYCIKYVELHRKDLLKQYKADMDYVEHFVVTPAMLEELYALAEKEGVERNEEEAKRSEELVSMIVKGLIGRDTYSQATYFKVYNQYDPIFKEALRIIESPEYNKILK